MKKAILLTILSIIAISCNNDDSSDNNEPQNPSENETTMKLKEFRGITTSKYYYHQNGFVDSISVIGGGMIQNNISKKFIYDSQKNLQTIETIVKSYSNETIDHNISTYLYNNLNQIKTVITQGVDNNAYISMNYNYNSEGLLNSSGRTYSNENLIQEGNITYTYDDKKNPYYEMYPLAYVRLNEINKNNTTSISNETETLVIINWTYNQKGYPVSFQKSPVIQDALNFAEYIYYL